MKTKLKPSKTSRLCAALPALSAALIFSALANDAPGPAKAGAPKASASIPWTEIGARVGADYRGDGLSATPTARGARLRCLFQRLDGEATTEGLWLNSTAEGSASERFRVAAASVGRADDEPSGGVLPTVWERSAQPDWEPRLAPTGSVSIDSQTVRFTRSGLTEEYSVSADGVRQDFVVAQRPEGTGELQVELAVTGARIEAAAGGARLALVGSGRKIAYSRMRVSDATGRELSARMEVLEPTVLAVLVNDAEAVYPVRIDPTFSDANWISMGGLPGTDNAVFAMAVDELGNLFIAGTFTVVGEIAANRIAKWNGSSWSALGSGMGGSPFGYPTVRALAVLGDDIYAGGRFTTAGGSAANYIAKWNGSSWSALGSGLNSEVDSLAVSGSDLYAGGSFTTAGGSAANHIAKWNGSSWSALGSGMSGGPFASRVYALAVSGGDLYAGGYFTTAGGSAANYIAKWDGSSWSALGSGMNSYVYALAVSDGDLYAGGDFFMAGDSAANHIAKWNGSSWSALGSGVDNRVIALAVSGSDLYAGGSFTTAGGSAANNIAKWNGSSWSALGSGMRGDPFSSAVGALVVSGRDLYVGGTFMTAGGSAANGIAKWNGSGWTALGSGMGINGPVNTLAVSGDDLYAGGSFSAAGGSPANRVAQWNGSSWSALGSGLDGEVRALAVSGSDLYAGGDFSMAGGDANYIAQWNGSSWSALGFGMDNPVVALAVSGGDLYAGGNFYAAGRIVANYIAKWHGSTWSALGSGMDSPVVALAVSGSDLYAGGNFTTAGGSAANSIAKWNGSSWSALGSGMDGIVNALAISGSDLYAGGDFTMAGGSPANSIAKWNGSSWSALGSGMDKPVVALAVSGSDLYAGGDFTMAGGSPVNSIAKWNGSSWSALGSGMSGSFIGGPTVRALAVSGSDLYAGGIFTTAGGKVSINIARASLDLPTLSFSRSGGAAILSWPSSFGRFVLQQNADVANLNGWSNSNYPITDNGSTISATIPITPGNQFFRLLGN